MGKPFYRPHIMYAPYPFHMMQEEYSQMPPYSQMPSYSQMPPYQAWPMMEYPPEVVDKDSEIEFWKGMYPEKMKKIQTFVEEACNKMDYEGSAMYDECPDKVTLYRIATMIYDMIMEEEDFDMGMDETTDEMDDSLESSQVRGQRPSRPRPPKRPKNPWLRDIVDVLLFEEIHRRRCKRNNCRGRRWY